MVDRRLRAAGRSRAHVVACSPWRRLSVSASGSKRSRATRSREHLRRAGNALVVSRLRGRFRFVGRTPPSSFHIAGTAAEMRRAIVTIARFGFRPGSSSRSLVRLERVPCHPRGHPGALAPFKISIKHAAAVSVLAQGALCLGPHPHPLAAPVLHPIRGRARHDSRDRSAQETAAMSGSALASPPSPRSPPSGKVRSPVRLFPRIPCAGGTL